MGVTLKCVLGNKRGHTVIRGVFGAGSGVRVDGALWESFSLWISGSAGGSNIILGGIGQFPDIC